MPGCAWNKDVVELVCATAHRDYFILCTVYFFLSAVSAIVLEEGLWQNRITLMLVYRQPLRNVFNMLYVTVLLRKDIFRTPTEPPGGPFEQYGNGATSFAG